MIAPHLPPKSCHIKTRHTIQSMPWILFFVFLAALTSVALTLVTIVWLSPSFFPDPLVTLPDRQSRQVDSDRLDPTVSNEVRRRVWQIYDTRQKIDKSFYPETATALNAIMFSSDGWAVVYAPNYRTGLERYWEGLDFQGKSYEIERVFVDRVSDLTYIKFGGEGLSFLSFADWNDVGEGSSVWSLEDGKWQRHILGEPVQTNTAKSYSIWQPQLFYYLDGTVAPGSVVINNNGELIGIPDNDSKLIYSWLADSQYASILENANTDYQSLPWRGYMVQGFVDQENGSRRVAGFYVLDSPSRATSSTIGVGDVILRVQNKPVESEHISRDLLFAPDRLPVSVLRDGEEIEVVVEKEKVD